MIIDIDVDNHNHDIDISNRTYLLLQSDHKQDARHDKLVNKEFDEEKKKIAKQILSKWQLWNSSPQLLNFLTNTQLLCQTS